MSFKLIKTLALTSVIAMGGVVASTGIADAHRACGKHYGWHKGWHYGWHKGWHGHNRTYARVTRPTYYGMSQPYGYTPATYGYGGYSPGYYGYGGYGGGGLFGGSGLLGLGTGIL